MSKTTVLVADDHAVLRSGLCLLINGQEDLAVIGEAADGDEAVTKCQKLKPHVVTLDVTMPGPSFRQTVRNIRRVSPETHVLVLTMHDDAGYVRQAITAGATGFVAKTAADFELLKAIRQVAKGEQLIRGERIEEQLQAPMVTSPADEMSPAQLVQKLSPREREVLLLLAKGHTNEEIAQAVFLSVKTVETYRARIRDKLGAKTRAELTRFVQDAGLGD